jgi:hypothetical protein
LVSILFTISTGAESVDDSFGILNLSMIEATENNDDDGVQEDLILGGVAFICERGDHDGFFDCAVDNPKFVLAHSEGITKKPQGETVSLWSLWPLCGQPPSPAACDC